MIIDSLRVIFNETHLIIFKLRLGGSGQLRFKMLEQLFRQIGELILPLHMKYLLHMADNEGFKSKEDILSVSQELR